MVDFAQALSEAGDPSLGVTGATPPLPKVSSPEEAAALEPGSKFIGPDNKERMVPYRASNAQDVADIPDGAHFIGPDGKMHEKPRYKGVGFTAQSLYDMSVNDKERRKALERSYPGKVKEDPAGGFFVEDDGVFRKPGRDIEQLTGFAAASAAPTALAILGALGGGAGGSAVPGAGTVAGVAAGGAGGAILGQSFNDMIMGLAGTYDRSRMEEAAELGIAGAGGAAGAGVGRGISVVVPSIKTGLSAATAAAPAAARSFLGAGQAELKTARELAEKNVLVPPSAVFKEAPHVQNLVEVFDPAFHTQKPLLQSATAHYEKSAGEVLNALGIKDPGTLTKPVADISAKQAGEKVLQKTLGELSEKDAQLQMELDVRKAAVQNTMPTQQNEAIFKAAEESKVAAQKLIDAGYQDIERDIDLGMKVAKADHNAGDLWGAIGQKFVSLRRAFGERANIMYDAADQAAGGHLPNIEGLPETAEQFLQQLPQDFQSKYPDIVKKLKELAGTRDEETGEWVKEPVHPTFGQLHNIRSQFRSNIDYADLTPGIRDGVYKFFAGKVDSILHGINETVETTSEQIEPRTFDAFSKNFPAERSTKFNSATINRVVNNIDPLINELDKKFPTLAKQLGEIRNQLKASNDNVDIDDIWDRLDSALSLVENNTGRSVLTDRLSKLLIDIGEIQDAPYLQHLKNKADLNGAYKAYKDTLSQIIDPNASWLKHTPARQMLDSLESPAKSLGSAAYDYAEKLAYEDGAKVLRSRLGGEERQIALKDASKLLKSADAFYADNIKIFNSQQVKAVMRGLQSGEPADPKNLYNVVVKSGQTDLTKKIKDMVGPNLWAGVKSADLQAMLDSAKTLTPGMIDGKSFAREILERYRNNTLEVVHGKEAADRLLTQARHIEMLDGRLEIPARPNDTATQILARAKQEELMAVEEAKTDPLAALNREMKQIEMEHKKQSVQLARERRKDPLGFLYDPTLGAAEAANKILDSEDLIIAAAGRFGQQSPEFEMLRQLWAQRLLTGTMRPGQRLAKVSPEVQQLMFPGVTLNQMQTLSKEMDFLLDTRAGKGAAAGMAAMARVEHPWGGDNTFGRLTQATIGKIPGTTPALRASLAAYYSTVRKLMTNPAFFRWLEKGLNGTEAEKQIIRQSIGAVLQKGSAIGAGAGELAVQGSGPQ